MRVLAIHHEDWGLFWRRAASRRKHRNLGSLDAAIREAGIGCDYHEIATGQPIRQGLERYSHVIVLGGNMGAYEDEAHRFLADEMRLLEKVVAAGVPVLGICLGAQLLARVHGARVYPGESGAELGWGQISLTEDGRREPMLGGLRQEAAVFQWHGDTFDLPAGATRLATSARYENQAFRIGHLVWALQFHLEADPALIGAWLREYGTAGSIDIDATKGETERFIGDYTAAAAAFMRGFLALGHDVPGEALRQAGEFPGSPDGRGSEG